VTYEDISFEVSEGIATITIDRPNNGNMLRTQTARELADALRTLRDDPQIGAAILTGAGDRFFCIGGEHEELKHLNPSAALPVVDVYELLDTVPKAIVAAVNGFAVGGGQVLQLMCDLAVAAESALFRQVGPMTGSFDAGYGTWYLEETIGRRRAKEMWYLNRKYSARAALEMGLVNEVVPDAEVRDRAREVARELLQRGPGAIAGLKASFSARHHGVLGQARLAHDQLLTRYLASDEAHELSDAFRSKRAPDPGRFGR
jgi:naphthoate synthase